MFERTAKPHKIVEIKSEIPHKLLSVLGYLEIARAHTPHASLIYGQLFMN